MFALPLTLLNHSYLLPFLLLFLEESGIPLPIPGDLVIVYIGYEISKGALQYHFAFLAILLGGLLGASVLYAVSSFYGNSFVNHFGKYMFLKQKQVRRVEKKFKQYGVLSIVFGRYIPGFRMPISVFSGMSKVIYRVFIVSTAFSMVLWINAYLFLGEKFGPKAIDQLHLNPTFIVLLLFLLIVARIVYMKQKIVRQEQ